MGLREAIAIATVIIITVHAHCNKEGTIVTLSVHNGTKVSE